MCVDAGLARTATACLKSERHCHTNRASPPFPHRHPPAERDSPPTCRPPPHTHRPPAPVSLLLHAELSVPLDGLAQLHRRYHQLLERNRAALEGSRLAQSLEAALVGVLLSGGGAEEEEGLSGEGADALTRALALRLLAAPAE